MEKHRKDLVIAVDGYSSCGKSTFARTIAGALDYIYVDSGAMYRAATLYCMENGLFGQTAEPDPAEVEGLLSGLEITFRPVPGQGQSDTLLNGENVEERIRSMEVSAHVSYISTIPAVRKKMVLLQREMGEKGGIAMDGRDIGTVVFPGADIKIFMTATVDIRAMRRYKELLSKGVEEDLEQVKHNIEERDRIDSSRKDSPLEQADDAVLLDNSHMTPAQQMKWFFREFGEKLMTDGKADYH